MKNVLSKWSMVEAISPYYPDGVILINEDTEIQRPVALLPLPLRKHPRGTQIQHNNARLIATSPELLSACQQAIKSIHPAAPVYKLLQSVIEKATGTKSASPELTEDSWVCEV